ncbi:NAD-dependent dihydropyrimidine dehydrogenase subunit PreA [Lacunisphaera limnophila]|uniref:NAD-dependent dihydropyrimidine dehydrogenase subunit PreA n=1 Tax=Lacunisphaera limnophila TaxID=1838286 RepID=A0A1D8ARM7_9BACT|nr:dihydroorotate dehydrogenase-like protein [Lacunisphaera limnophila]AOS43551.1 NAD-dependent dihydropyrimidine dehydrogenase subunit PreA [Lacunisphaera limnophila]
MNLTTTYLGLKLANPLLPGASPLVDNMDSVRRLQDAGAPAIVMHSLYAEQLEGNAVAFDRHLGRWQDSFAEATTMFPETGDYRLGPDEYLERLGCIKRVTGLPVIASLNGNQPGSWTDYAKLMEQAGADAIELNTYFLATQMSVSGPDLEQRLMDIVRAVRSNVRIPIAVKLSSFYTSVAHLAGGLEKEKVDGLVLFNRFFQPEIDTETLEVRPHLDLSTAEDLRLRLRWLGLLRDQVKLNLSCSGGVQRSDDVVKAILAGADTVQTVAALLRHGPGEFARLLAGLRQWMEEHEYDSVTKMRGALSLKRCADPEAYERGNYLRSMQLWRE